jgi:hypothetical protein
VFQGPALKSTTTAAPERIFDVETEQADPDAQPRHLAALPQPDVESEIGTIPIDTTAELLGRAKARKPRSRLGVRAPEAPAATGAPASARARKPAARKTAAPRRSVKSKKDAAADE